MESKRLYRSLTDRKFAGVAGGLGEYFVMDPLLLRLAFVILALAGGGGFLIYIVLWIVTPENPVRVQPAMNQPKQDPQQQASEPSFNADGSEKTDFTFTTAPPPPGPANQRTEKGKSDRGPGADYPWRLVPC